MMCSATEMLVRCLFDDTAQLARQGPSSSRRQRRCCTRCGAASGPTQMLPYPVSNVLLFPRAHNLIPVHTLIPLTPLVCYEHVLPMLCTHSHQASVTLDQPAMHLLRPLRVLCVLKCCAPVIFSRASDCCVCARSPGVSPAAHRPEQPAAGLGQRQRHDGPRLRGAIARSLLVPCAWPADTSIHLVEARYAAA